VKRIKAVYCIKVLRGDKVGTWVIDVKNGTGSVKYDPAGINLFHFMNLLLPHVFTVFNQLAIGLEWETLQLAY